VVPSVVQRMDFSPSYDPEAYEQDEFGNVLPKEPEGGWEAYEQDVNRYFAQQYEEEQQRLEDERMDRMIDEYTKEEEMTYKDDDSQLQLQEYEKEEREIDQYYESLYKDHVRENIQRCLATPFGKLGKNIQYLRQFMKQGDTPPFSPQEKELINKQIVSTIKKRIGQFPMVAPSGTGANNEKKFAWAKKALIFLNEEGYNISDVYSSTKESYEKNNGSKFSGYVFQIEQHIQSWSKCKLLEIEPKTSDYHRADEVPLSHTHKFVDYKNYDEGSKKFAAEVQQQISNYAADSQYWPPNTILIIKFKHGVPEWYSNIIEQQKNKFRNDIQIRLKTAKQNTFGTKSIKSFFSK